MKSLPLIGRTRRIGAPAGWDHEKNGICHTIEVSDAEGFMTTAWEFTDAERARIAAGAPMYLHVGGSPQTQHPVVGFTVGTLAHLVDEAGPRWTGDLCSDCGELQFDSPGGVTCINGHGGADPARRIKCSVCESSMISTHDVGVCAKCKGIT